MRYPNEGIGRVTTKYGECLVCVDRYAKGATIAVQLFATGDFPEPMGTLSTNIVGLQLPHDEFFVKTWSENEPLVAPLLACGLFADTGKRAGDAHIWKIVDTKHIPELPAHLRKKCAG
jgi:hypothetical protein